MIRPGIMIRPRIVPKYIVHVESKEENQHKRTREDVLSMAKVGGALLAFAIKTVCSACMFSSACLGQLKFSDN